MVLPTQGPGGIASPGQDDLELLAKDDPLATQIWRMYAKQREHLPNAARMENITWRMMAMTLQRQRESGSLTGNDPTPPFEAGSGTLPANGASWDVGVSAPSASPARARQMVPPTASAPSSAHADVADASETRRGRQTTIRPLDASALSRVSHDGVERTHRFGQRSRSRSMSIMDFESERRRRGASRHRKSGLVAVEPFPFAHDTSLPSEVTHPGMGSSSEPQFLFHDNAPLDASLSSLIQDHVDYSNPNVLPQWGANGPSGASDKVSEAQASVEQHTDSFGTDASSGNDQQRMANEFTSGAFRNLFEPSTIGSWQAATSLEHQAHTMLQLSQKNESDERWLATHAILDSVPGIDDYAAHEANQHPVYGFLPRLVRKTSFDHKVRERSESRGPRGRVDVLSGTSAAQEDEHAQARKRVRDASPLSIRLRTAATAEQRMASGLSRQVPTTLYNGETFSFAMPTSFEFPFMNPSASGNLQSNVLPSHMQDGQSMALPTNHSLVNSQIPLSVMSSTVSTPMEVVANSFPFSTSVNLVPQAPTSPTSSHLTSNVAHVDPSQLLAQQQTGSSLPFHKTDMPHPSTNALYVGNDGMENYAHISMQASSHASSPNHGQDLYAAVPGGSANYYTSVFETSEGMYPKGGVADMGMNSFSASPSQPVPTDLNMQLMTYNTESYNAMEGTTSPSTATKPYDVRASASSSPSAPTEPAPIVCSNCQTTKTPLWRRDSEGNALCNACGLFQRLHGVMRPLSLKSDVIKKRNRTSTATRDGRSGGSKPSGRRGSRAFVPNQTASGNTSSNPSPPDSNSTASMAPNTRAN